MFATDEQLAAAIVGKNITGVLVNEEYLVFAVEGADPVGFEVYAECCSDSYFHDVIGVRKLLDNGPVVSFKEIPLWETNEDIIGWDEDNYTDTKVYGYEIVTEHPFWGEQTTVISFRNESNGYYGGDLLLTDDVARVLEMRTFLNLTEDCLDIPRTMEKHRG